MSRKKQKISHARVKDSYVTDAGVRIQNKFLRKVVRTIFHRRAPRERTLWHNFYFSFSGTKLRWYSNFLNDWYGEGGGKVACFFTEEGAEILIVYVEGNLTPDAIELPEKLDEYLTDREKEKKKLHIDKNSVKEGERGNEFFFQFGGQLEVQDKEQEYFEHTICEGLDKVVLRALVPKTADSRTLSDVQTVAKSLRMK